ncbi:MAG: AGE family epimerase/isomerase [Lacibacter sp.]
MTTLKADISSDILTQYKSEMKEELNTILSYWMKYTIDKEQGGFYGSINNENIPDRTAPKGIVLNSRILWTFSAAYEFTKEQSHLNTAETALSYIIDHFIDHEYGGVFWSVNPAGKMMDGRKQIYGIAFCIYGMAAYYKASGNGIALHFAKDLYNCIEQYSFDEKKGGYIEAFDRKWKDADDLRLSDKDDNERKTMNTHLHIIEAYAELYKVWPDDGLRKKIIHLIELFQQHFISKENYHLHLFFTDDWISKSTLQSYGHDIEASWLLQQCAEAIEHQSLIEIFKQLAISIADAAAEGLDTDGGLWYEYEPEKNLLIHEKHSWPQAEAMIGFFNAYQLNGNEKYLQYSLQSWEFVKKYILNKEKGEWYWGVHKDYSLMQKEKAGFWKCPYHNSRACMEMYKRISIVP